MGGEGARRRSAVSASPSPLSRRHRAALLFSAPPSSLPQQTTLLRARTHSPPRGERDTQTMSDGLRQRRGGGAAEGAGGSTATDTDDTNPPAPPPAVLKPINLQAFDALLGATLVRKRPAGEAATGEGGDSVPLETLTLRDALGDAAHSVSLYFSAHWCPPCRAFTPELARMHIKLTDNDNDNNPTLQWPVIFVSLDKTPAAFLDYFSAMPSSWLAVPFEDDQLRSVLLRKLNVQGIPTLAMLDPRTAGVEAPNARASVSADPEGRVFPWRGATGGGPAGLLGNPRLLMMVLMLVYQLVINVLMPWWRGRSGGGGGGLASA